MATQTDVAIIGGGIIGLATAYIVIRDCVVFLRRFLIFDFRFGDRRIANQKSKIAATVCGFAALSGPRSEVPVPRRTLHAADPRRRRVRPERGADVCSRGIHQAGHQSDRPVFESLTYPGFLRMAAKHWRAGCGEMWRSFSQAAFVRALQRLLPDIRAEHLRPAPSGVLKLSAETASWSTTLRSWRTISSYTCSTPLRPPPRRH